MENNTANLPVFIQAQQCKQAQNGLYNMLRKPLEGRIEWAKDKACNMSGLMQLLKSNPLAIVMLSVQLQGFNLLALTILKQTFPMASIIIESVNYSPYYLKYINNGLALSYLFTAEATPSDYVKAIEACLENKVWLPPFVEQQKTYEKNELSDLDDLEKEILYLFLADNQIKEIGLILSIDYQKVNRTIKKIYALTGCNSILSLLKYAMDHHIINNEVLHGFLP
jgi:DNA-binding NarL/FixJ family response regulator